MAHGLKRRDHGGARDAAVEVDVDPAERDGVLDDRVAATRIIGGEDVAERRPGTQVRKRDILMDLFGENAARDGYRQAVERAGMQSRSGQFAAAGTGAVSFSGIVPMGSTAAPTHKFYGGAAR